MSDIWHTKDEIPRQESRVLWKSGNVVCGGRFDTHYKCFCGPASQFVDLRNVSRWCYVDDLIKENERTRKALDAARNGLEYIFGYEGVPEYVAKHVRQVLDQIKSETALEQKESVVAHNKIEFPEFNDNLLEEFDKQFFENGQDDDLTETALEQKDVK